MDFIINDDLVIAHEEDDTDEFRDFFYPQLPGYLWVAGRQTPIDIRRKIISEFIFDICELNEISEDNGDDKYLLADDLALYLVLKHLGIECSEEYENKDKVIRLFYNIKSQYLSSDYIRNEAFVERDGNRFQIISKVVRMQRKEGGKNVLNYLLSVRKI